MVIVGVALLTFITINTILTHSRGVDGVQPGELVVTDGAIFLDNMLQAPVDD